VQEPSKPSYPSEEENFVHWSFPSLFDNRTWDNDMLHIEFLYVKMQQCTPADSMCSYKNMKLFSTKANLSSYKAIKEFYALEILKTKILSIQIIAKLLSRISFVHQ